MAHGVYLSPLPCCLAERRRVSLCARPSESVSSASGWGAKRGSPAGSPSVCGSAYPSGSLVPHGVPSALRTRRWWSLEVLPVAAFVPEAILDGTPSADVPELHAVRDA